MVSLGSATTDHSGNASLLYKPPSAGRYIIHVVAGGGDLTQSNVTLALVSSKGFSPLELPQTNVVSQNYWPDPRLVGAPIEANTVLIVLVSSVVMTAWGIIMYTVGTLSRIKSEARENGRAF